MKLSADSKEALMKQLLAEYLEDIETEYKTYKRRYKAGGKDHQRIDLEDAKKTRAAFRELTRYFGVKQ